MKKYVYFLIFLVLTACKKQEYNIDNLNGGTITKLGHAGMGTTGTYPMNTAESIRKCLSYPMDGTEMDVQMTSDGVLVAFHDERLELKTNLDGVVNAHSWDEISKGKYIVIPHIQYNIVRLDELLASLDAQNLFLAFDVKLYPQGDFTLYRENYKNALISLVETYTDPAKVMIESQDTVFLNMIKAEKPSYRLFYYPSGFEDGLETAKKFGYTGMAISTHIISVEQIAEAHQNGLMVSVWDTHSKKDTRKAILKNADIIETDKVVYLSKILK